MIEIPFRLVGYVAHMSEAHADFFNTRSEVREFNPKRHQIEKRNVAVPFYRVVGDGTIAVPFGLVLFLIQHRPDVKFRLVEVVNRNTFKRFDFHAGNDFLRDYLREHQMRCYIAAQSRRGGGIEMATGGGKSALEVAIATSCAVDHDVVMLMPSQVTQKNILAEFDVLEERCRRRFEGFELVKYEELRNSRYCKDQHRIVIASATQVLNDVENGLNLIEDAGTLISDECHHWEADTWQRFISALPNIVRSYGFSATLLSKEAPTDLNRLPTEDANIIAGCGPALISIGPPELKDWLDLPDIVNLAYTWPQEKRSKSNNWPRLYGTVKKNSARTDLIARVIDHCSGLGRMTTVPVAEKTQALNILRACNSDRVMCWFGGGAAVTPRGERNYEHEDIKELLRSGQYDTIIVTPHVDEAFDLPAINTVFFTEGRKPRKTKQRAGRCVRPSDSKSIVINLYDVDDFVLQAQARNRSKTLQDYYETRVIPASDMSDLVAVLKDMNNRAALK